LFTAVLGFWLVAFAATDCTGFFASGFGTAA
jgi:hypothetical protein